MEIRQVSAEEEAAAVWEWGSLLDFTIVEDDPLILPWDGSDELELSSPPPHPASAVDLAPPLPTLAPPASPAPSGGSNNVRKRDPRLVCENYLAGRVPCSCPEVDEQILEEEEAAAEVVAGGRKRARAGGASVASIRCQVPGCEADIRELKGYHRRHRVCLQCANASSVILDGEPKRYCQQCGKFHILPDFDEGKRSCRRKLERHNRRRRRRPTDFTSVEEKEKESRSDLSTDVTYDGQQTEGMLNGFACEEVETDVCDKVTERELLVDSEEKHGSPVCSLPSVQNIQSNSFVPVAVSVDGHMDEKTDNSKSAISSTFSGNKSFYSSVCPTGRISFKLYDWNPAEFPRRLRHQIFQWLARMPVELEGYIRPGCTILTIFIAMPQFMWEKFSQDAVLHIRDLVSAPESLFLGRGNFFIYLSDMIIQVLKDGTSLMNIKMDVKAPRLHYVHPTYFEAGKPMEFVACGSNLDQPKFRFLVSFAGKYLVYDSICTLSQGKIKSYDGNRREFFHNSEHELFRIRISRTDSKHFGPAFIEVENESGISNFIPVLFGNNHICSELERIQGTFCEPLCTDNFSAVSGASLDLCKLCVSKQASMSELLMDIAWLLKEPHMDQSEAVLSSINIQRLTCLFKFSVQNEFVSGLEAILHYVDTMIGELGFSKLENVTSDADLKLLLEYMNHARVILNQRSLHDVGSELDLGSSNRMILRPQSHVISSAIFSMPCTSKGGEGGNDGLYPTTTAASHENNDQNIPLLRKDGVIGRKCCYPQLGVTSRANVFPYKVTSTHLAVFMTVGVVVCFSACIVLLHPHKAGEFAVSVRRCLFGNHMP